MLERYLKGVPGRGRADLERLCRRAGVRFASELASQPPVFESGLSVLEALPSGGLPLHGLSELVESGAGRGGTVVLHHLLQRMSAGRAYAALVDGSDSFAPDALDAASLRHLYWVRCRGSAEALRVADLIAHDPNFALCVLDLRWNALSELRRVPGRYWYRLQRGLLSHRCTGVVLSPVPLVPAASLRLRLESVFGLDALDCPRTFILERLALEPLGADGVLRRSG